MARADSQPIPSKFATTQWSLVVAAGEHPSPASQSALSDLCSRYWYPLYAWLRRQGDSHEAAQDHVQGCLLDLIAHRRLEVADREHGRFRTFLLTCLKHHRANQIRLASAQKRGGTQQPWSLDFQTAQSHWDLEPIDTLTPDRLFDRKWAMQLIQRSLDQLEQDCQRRDKGELFAAVKPLLSGYDQDSTYQEVSQRLGLTLSAVKVAVYRWRNQLRENIRQEIRQTVASDAEVDEELEYLLDVLAH